jgi:ceramide glucosyltransferase
MGLFWVFGSVALFGMIIYAVQILAVHRALRSPRNPNTESSSFRFPPISILKPLKGLEDNLFDNLESFCSQDYPEYEIICSLQDENDPSHKVAQKVQEKFPDKSISIIIERCNQGLNPKVNNLFSAYRHSRYATFLISDSNVKVDPDYLRRIASALDGPEVGLVCNLIRGVGGRTLGSIFENLHLNSFILGNICMLDRYFHRSCVVGKSMLMRKSDLEAIGGLTSVKDVLAEDHFIGQRVRERNQRVVISNYLISNVNEYWGLRKFINRHVRWGKMRWKIEGMKYFAELAVNPVFICGLPILFEGATRETVSLFLGVSGAKMVGDFYLGRKIGEFLHPLAYVLAPVKDLLIGLIWFVPFVNDTVTWRGNRYRIGKDSVLSPCGEKGAWVWSYRVANAIRERFV